MPDEMTPTPAPVPGDLFQARIGLLSAVNGLVHFARSLPEGLARDTVRLAMHETCAAVIRVFPQATGEAAQAHARRMAEIPLPQEGEPVKISGPTGEEYADQLVRYLFAHGEEGA